MSATHAQVSPKRLSLTSYMSGLFRDTLRFTNVPSRWNNTRVLMAKGRPSPLGHMGARDSRNKFGTIDELIAHFRFHPPDYPEIFFGPILRCSVLGGSMVALASGGPYH